jgi:hypothetical protein
MLAPMEIILVKIKYILNNISGKHNNIILTVKWDHLRYWRTQCGVKDQMSQILIKLY